MQRRHRRRRPQYNEPKSLKGYIRIAAAIGVLVLVFMIGKSTLEFFGVGNAKRQTATILTLEPGGIVNISVEGGPLKRAETDVKLYAGDAIVTSPRNYARLDFFDGTSMRLDESTHTLIEVSEKGEEKSAVTIELEEGTLWVVTPTLSTFSGAITRTIKSPYMQATVPSEAEVVFTERSLAVFSADGIGLTVTVAGNDETIIVGEGQQFTLPPGGEQTADLYSYRNPLSTEQVLTQFVEDSRAGFKSTASSSKQADTTPDESSSDNIILEIQSPEDGITVDASTITVSGRIGSAVDKVRINGYLANINAQAGTFEEDLALPDEDEVSITIEAIDKDGIALAEGIRTLSRNRKPPEAPVISSPAGNDETYVTTRPEIEISGRAPQGAVGILVNDYRLQLFEPGDTTWSYLANVEFNNMRVGENVYEVIAINRGGYRSEPASVTIIYNPEGQEGVVNEEVAEGTEATEGADVQPVPTTVEEADLPNNAPLSPGTLVITSPAAGTEYTTREVENLIEGNVPNGTYSVWVNGYRLRLFEPGKTFFNYIASVELNTLKRGRNAYRIVARNEAGEILDQLTYILNLEL